MNVCEMILVMKVMCVVIANDIIIINVRLLFNINNDVMN